MGEGYRLTHLGSDLARQLQALQPIANRWARTVAHRPAEPRTARLPPP